MAWSSSTTTNYLYVFAADGLLVACCLLPASLVHTFVASLLATCMLDASLRDLRDFATNKRCNGT